MEQPEAALRFFGEALGFGMPEASLAGDRGLAYDMLGQIVRAQRDYRLALGGITLSATACNTVKGAGRDIESVGEAGADAID